MNCPNCNTLLWQEHTTITDTHKVVERNKDAQMVCDNWHCQKCGSVYTNKEIQEDTTSMEDKLEALDELNDDQLYKDNQINSLK